MNLHLSHTLSDKASFHNEKYAAFLSTVDTFDEVLEVLLPSTAGTTTFILPTLDVDALEVVGGLILCDVALLLSFLDLPPLEISEVQMFFPTPTPFSFFLVSTELVCGALALPCASRFRRRDLMPSTV